MFGGSQVSLFVAAVRNRPFLELESKQFSYRRLYTIVFLLFLPFDQTCEPCELSFFEVIKTFLLFHISVGVDYFYFYL